MTTTIEFKSYYKFYYKEKNGLKNNTVRISDNSLRFKQLDLFESDEYEGEYLIKIIHHKNPNEYFIRQIKDVSIYKDMYIITWRD